MICTRVTYLDGALALLRGDGVDVVPPLAQQRGHCLRRELPETANNASNCTHARTEREREREMPAGERERERHAQANGVGESVVSRW